MVTVRVAFVPGANPPKVLLAGPAAFACVRGRRVAVQTRRLRNTVFIGEGVSQFVTHLDRLSPEIDKEKVHAVTSSELANHGRVVRYH